MVVRTDTETKRRGGLKIASLEPGRLRGSKEQWRKRCTERQRHSVEADTAEINPPWPLTRARGRARTLPRQARDLEPAETALRDSNHCPLIPLIHANQHRLIPAHARDSRAVDFPQSKTQNPNSKIRSAISRGPQPATFERANLERWPIRLPARWPVRFFRRFHMPKRPPQQQVVHDLRAAADPEGQIHPRG